MHKRLAVLLVLLSGCGLFKEPENELTTVGGTVRNEFDQRPVANAIVELRSCDYFPYHGGWICSDVDDTVRTDANGNYAFSFRTQRRKAYRVEVKRTDQGVSPYYPDEYDNRDPNHLLTEGQANTVDMLVYYNMVLRVHLVNRNAGRRFMDVGYTRIIGAGTIDTVVYLHELPRNRPLLLQGYFYNRNTTSYAVDTLSIRKVVPIGGADTAYTDFGLIR